MTHKGFSMEGGLVTWIKHVAATRADKLQAEQTGTCTCIFLNHNSPHHLICTAARKRRDSTSFFKISEKHLIMLTFKVATHFFVIALFGM